MTCNHLSEFGLQANPSGERVKRTGYREIFVPLNASNGCNAGLILEKHSPMGVCEGKLQAIGDGYFGMGGAAVEAGEQGGGFRGDDCGFKVGAGESADGFERAPGGFNDDFDFAFEATMGDNGSEVAGDAVEFEQNVFGKIFKICGQLRLGGAGGPAAQDGSGCSVRGCGGCIYGGSRLLVANDDVPGA